MNSGPLIHPSVVFYGDVVVGYGSVIGPGVVIYGPVALGCNSYVGANCVLGAIPEDASQNAIERLMQHSFSEIQTRPKIEVRETFDDSIDKPLLIRDRVVIRENCVLHRGIRKPTIVGSGSYIHSRSGVNHDCELGSGVVLAPGVSLAGNVHIGSQAQIGLGAGIRQGIKVGPFVMVGMNAAVVRDCVPLSLCRGVPGRLVGANAVRLRRWGLSERVISEFSSAICEGDRLPVHLLPPQYADTVTAWYGP